jgi:hypothetical protein
LVFQPAYSEKWRPFIRVTAEYELPQKSGKLTVTGNEYFKDVRVVTDSLDQFYDGRILKTDIPVNYEANWIKVVGNTTVKRGDMDTVQINWEIYSQRPWFQTYLEIRPDTAGITDPESELSYFLDKNALKFFWYGHYRDTLKVDSRFAIEKGAKIIRKVRSKYLEMPVKIDVTSQLANIEYRTTVQYQDTISIE